ncbi:hypothetical protein GFER_05260 [Geoalkalibacter ferrihydriticus DSM 17813]|uniref:Uncharacterized protein n=1 Tax=Geoalkalibacter ferrihydriticus DSM 17813 TaxID=1121915 RepID=A0A0C2EH66_9BACT|nr:hypothetical protein GFER_05260 [Geoalkalibacter ferrihydriticus DSM 17813]
MNFTRYIGFDTHLYTLKNIFLDLYLIAGFERLIAGQRHRRMGPIEFIVALCFTDLIPETTFTIRLRFNHGTPLMTIYLG